MVKVIIFLLVFLSSTVSEAQWRGTEWSLVDGYDVVEYTSRIVGKFTTTSQHNEEPYFDNVTVETFLIGDDVDGLWIYTEQSNTGDSIPYRRRVYNIVWLNDTTIVSRVYQLQNPNKLNRETLRSGVQKSELRYMEGCDTYIRKGIDGNYYGHIEPYICRGSYMGANYTTSEFRVYPHMVVSWERGWKDDGTQVWGSSRGYYYYRKYTTPRPHRIREW
jgi:hypothetical protein